MPRKARRPGHLPPVESPSRRLLIRSVALVALAVTAAYLGWRALATLNLDAWYVAVPMFALELHAAVGLGLFTFSLWDVDSRPERRRLRRLPRVAVAIPTYNEGPEILVPTIAAAVALEPNHETWVLDDGNRPEIAELAVALGARYLARATNEHAKAGNLNHALGVIEADILAVLDADHVAAPDFLTATLGYFADRRVALVQTPQDFYNVTSFEHGSGTAYGEPYHEQTLFYRLLQPGKNRWHAAFWCGTNALVRVAALREIGGAATDTITEDIHTTIRLHRRGWKTVYHNEVLARGLAADDAAQYQLQRNRWGTGAMQVLRAENPLFVSGLSLGQRLAYASTLLGWFDSWRTLGFLILPPVVLLTGRIPIVADGLTFAAIFGLTYALQQVALYLLGRGAYRPVLSIVFDLVRMSPNFLATLSLFVPRTPRFRVTPKGRIAADRGRVAAPAMLRVMDALTGVANRRAFMQRLTSEIEVALAVGQPLSIAIADFDHFKFVNDTLGHPVGDLALRQSATIMRRHCGHSDMLARIGGEEFALILPGMTRDDATGFCETLRAAVAAHEWREMHPQLAITISIGLAQWDGSADLPELLHAADTQLYRAKRAGRNQVA